MQQKVSHAEVKMIKKYENIGRKSESSEGKEALNVW